MVARTVDEVIDQLDIIVDRARREKSRIGFFAALYRKVTAKVRDGIISGRFEDGERMQQLDVLFANRYLEALERFRQDRQPNQCWLVAFEAANSRRVLILQHLLLGINAHINFDLGIAAAQTSPGEQLPSLKRDFDEISKMLAELVDEVQDEIGILSPWFWLLDHIGGRTDEAIIKFSLDKARGAAWSVAERLALLRHDQWELELDKLCREVATLGRLIRKPGRLLSLGLLVIRLRENSNTARIIDILSSNG